MLTVTTPSNRESFACLLEYVCTGACLRVYVCAGACLRVYMCAGACLQAHSFKHLYPSQETGGEEEKGTHNFYFNWK